MSSSILDRHTGMNVKPTSQVGSNSALSLDFFLYCITEYLPVPQRERVSGFCHNTLVSLTQTSPTSLQNLCMHLFVPHPRKIKFYGNYYSHSSIFCIFQLTAHILINNYLLCHANFSSPTCFGLQRPYSRTG